MVHRPADSRLLTNLLSHEKDYSKHFSILLEYSQASLASFSAYAAASAPPTSQVIVAVAGALAGADDALRNYASAVGRWQEQLKVLKKMEDDLGNIMRDREILVTRLIKATKQQKSNRDSYLGSSPSGSSLSIPTSKSEVQIGPRMTNAQTELQACEAQLAAKEQELEAFRTHTVRSGLHARCKAMVECGWAWGEMGKEGIRALETLDMPNGHAPSQSASQIGHSPSDSSLAVGPTFRTSSAFTTTTPSNPYTLHIPAAHSIKDFDLPNGVATPATIVEETGGSSAEEEDASHLEVYENPRFSKRKPKAKTDPPPSPSRHVSFTVRGPKGSPRDHVPTSFPLRGDSPNKKRGRAGMLGSLAALFHVGGSRVDEETSSNGSSKANGRWQTRIDKNVAAARRGDSSDDESPHLSHSYAGRTDSPQSILLNGNALEGGGTAKLKKRASKRSSSQVQSPSHTAPPKDKGYTSDTVTDSMSNARAKGRRQQTPTKQSTVEVFGSAVKIPNGVPGPSGSGQLKKSPTINAVVAAEGDSSLFRNSSVSKQSVTSVASAPPRTTAITQSTPGRRNTAPRKRTASLNTSPAKTAPSTPNGHKRTMSTTVPTRLTLTNGESNLVSLVESISRLNKEAAIKQDPNRLLVVPKAPGPIGVSIRDSIGEIPVVSPDTGGSPVRREAKGSHQPLEENSYGNSLHMNGSASAPSQPLSDRSKPLPTPVKMPLRSALRASRTPSPQPVHSEVNRNGASSSKPTNGISGPPDVVPDIAPTFSVVRPTMQRRLSDISSISSYETGHEVLDDEPSPPASPVQRPSSPESTQTTQLSAPSQLDTDAHKQDGSELSHSTNSTNLTATTDQPPKRRKSVRMSLPPTFSVTPPAIEDTEEDEQSRHVPWASPGGGSIAPHGWGTRIEQHGARDVWEDDSSDSDDGVYSTAKKILARQSSKKHEHER